jgi:hypothetical protein
MRVWRAMAIAHAGRHVEGLAGSRLADFEEPHYMAFAMQGGNHLDQPSSPVQDPVLIHVKKNT